MTKRVLLISFKKKRPKFLTNEASCCIFADRVFIILKSNLQTLFAVEIKMPIEEYMRLQEHQLAPQVECAILREQLARVTAERDSLLRAQVLASRLEEMARQGDSGKVIPLMLSKIHTALAGLDSMDEVRLVLFSILKMLPDNVPAETMKMIAEAVPEKLPGKELVKIELEKAKDVIENGGTKNVFVKPEDGGTER